MKPSTCSSKASQNNADPVPPLTVVPLTGPRRIGSWSIEEIEYCHYLSEEFKASRLEGIPNGASLRQWLGKQLNCAPMRLSKKFDKDSGMLGLVKFEANHEALAALSPADRRRHAKTLHDLRRRLESTVAREMAGLKPLVHHLVKHRGRCVPKTNRRKVQGTDVLFRTKAVYPMYKIVPRKSNRACARQPLNYSAFDDSSESGNDDVLEYDPLPFHPVSSTTKRMDIVDSNGGDEVLGGSSCLSNGVMETACLTDEEVQWLESFANDLPPINAADHSFWKSIQEIECSCIIEPSVVFASIKTEDPHVVFPPIKTEDTHAAFDAIKLENDV
ncbi:Aste57867_12777 [Aphanomyces stellatus]|uniref:Aste57867_12777 protein n=1 Tax=Aphanomyces stellatus TaxID=120398 RepID=A0A485KXV7_9STRA|nr:hypothetical protein As57867_012729 [Aphanomyces stellatus]VFT89626.1 Aste57867_12777 [Aphanomyces stellatus]